MISAAPPPGKAAPTAGLSDEALPGRGLSDDQQAHNLLWPRYTTVRKVPELCKLFPPHGCDTDHAWLAQTWLTATTSQGPKIKPPPQTPPHPPHREAVAAAQQSSLRPSAPCTHMPP